MSIANSSAPLPPNWDERFDPASGRKFYINHQTQETTWTRPRAEGASLYPTIARNTPREAWDMSELSERLEEDT